MKYSKEIIELMSAYPGKAFKLMNIKRYVASVNNNSAKSDSIRSAIRHVLYKLKDAGVIEIKESGKNGGGNIYIWK